MFLVLGCADFNAMGEIVESLGARFPELTSIVVYGPFSATLCLDEFDYRLARPFISVVETRALVNDTLDLQCLPDKFAGPG
jgi:hypothetical protein